MKLLGIDYGLRKIGLAIAEAGFVRPLMVLKNSPDLITRLAKICQENQIEKIIVGLPEGKLVPQVKKFSQILAKAVFPPLDFQDENLTTQDAIAKMIEAGKKRRQRRLNEDAVAAACLLEEYLSKNV